jgi:cytochrome oxidase Cu insertion factor (SCO1/SenC/PrrC family)
MSRATRLLAVLLAGALAVPAAHAGDLPAPTTPASRQAKARDYFTDTVLMNQDGKQVRFFSDVLDGNVVVLSFVFTRCVGACPLICQKLNGVRRQLGDEFRNVRFVSFSVDPEFDTPAELTRFASKMEAVYPNWTFLGGKKENVSYVVKRLGEWPEEPGDHTTAFMAGNVRTGHWTKIRPDMPAAAIADTLRRLIAEDQGDGESPPRAAN